MQYLTLVDFLAEITYRKKICLSVFDYYGIFKPSPSYVNLVIYTHTQKTNHISKDIAFKCDDALQFIFNGENENYCYLCGFLPKN